MQTPVTQKKRQQAGERITIVGAVANVVLSALKIAVGLLSGSLALVADGFHSLADLISDFAVVVLYRIANKRPDQNHPWGHARFETLGTIFVAVLLAAVGAGIFYRATEQLVVGDGLATPGWVALIVAAISLVAKEILYQYTVAVGNKYNSKLIIANAWHHRTDMFSSALVFAAIAGAIAGIWWLDALGAILVSLFLFWLAAKMLWDSLTELVDTALPPSETEAIRKEALDVPGVLEVRGLKTRRAGPQTYVEMHIQVDERITAAEGHFIGQQVTSKLRRQRNDLTHLIYHIDVEGKRPPGTTQLNHPLPTDIRGFIMQQLVKQYGIESAAEEIEIDLYIKRDYFDVDIKLPSSLSIQPELKVSVSNALKSKYEHFGQLKVYQQL